MKYLYTLLSIGTLLILSGCGQKPSPAPRPKYPNYEIIKPKVKYTASRKNLAKMVKQLQGSPYVWAEEGPDRFDCSGFTYYMYGSMGIEIPRVAREQAKVGKRVRLQDLQYGDLLFFATNRHNRRKITHVGMYLGNGWFTHASTVKKEVIYTNLYTSPYYKRRLRICRRYLPDEPQSKQSPNSTEKPIWQYTEAIPAAQPTPSDPATQAAQIPLQERSKESSGKAVVIQAPIKQIEQPKTSKGIYYVQIGSFAKEPKNTLLYSIKEKGLPYKLIKFPIGSISVVKLLVGPYRTHRGRAGACPCA